MRSYSNTSGGVPGSLMSRRPSPATRPPKPHLQEDVFMARGPWIDHFGDNFLWSNATLIIKGMAPYGVVALEEMDRVCEKLRMRQHEPQAWQEEWGAMAELIETRADAAAAEGRRHSAGDYYL